MHEKMRPSFWLVVLHWRCVSVVSLTACVCGHFHLLIDLCWSWISCWELRSQCDLDIQLCVCACACARRCVIEFLPQDENFQMWFLIGPLAALTQQHLPTNPAPFIPHVVFLRRFRVTKCERSTRERRTLLISDSNGSAPTSPTETQPKSRTTSESQQVGVLEPPHTS